MCATDIFFFICYQIIHSRIQKQLSQSEKSLFKQLWDYRALMVHREICYFYSFAGGLGRMCIKDDNSRFSKEDTKKALPALSYGKKYCVFLCLLTAM